MSLSVGLVYLARTMVRQTPNGLANEEDEGKKTASEAFNPPQFNEFEGTIRDFSVCHYEYNQFQRMEKCVSIKAEIKNRYEEGLNRFKIGEAFLASGDNIEANLKFREADRFFNYAQALFRTNQDGTRDYSVSSPQINHAKLAAQAKLPNNYPHLPGLSFVTGGTPFDLCGELRAQNMEYYQKKELGLICDNLEGSEKAPANRMLYQLIPSATEIFRRYSTSMPDHELTFVFKVSVKSDGSAEVKVVPSEDEISNLDEGYKEKLSTRFEHLMIKIKENMDFGPTPTNLNFSLTFIKSDTTIQVLQQ
ncbi:MAG: hypothetical protein ABIH50_00215 [bacterium]